MKLNIFLAPVYLFLSFTSILSKEQERPKSFIRSSTYLNLFATAEVEFIDRLLRYRHQLEIPLQNSVQGYLDTYQRNTKSLKGYAESATNSEKAVAIISSFISIYQLIHRWIHNVTPIKQILSRQNSELVEPLRSYHGFTEQDLNESMSDILYIFHVHNVDVEMAVDGVIRGFDPGPELSAEQCFQVANYGQLRKYLALSIQFYEQALRKNSSVPRDLIQSSLNETIREHDALVTNHSLHPYEKQYLFNRRLTPLIKRYGEQQKLIRIYQRVLLARVHPQTLPRYKMQALKIVIPFMLDLCLHRNLQDEETKSALFCWYESSISPYFNIGPLKMELLSRTPELVQIYDMISPSKIKSIKEVLANTSYRNATTTEKRHAKYVEAILNFEETKFLPLESKVLSAFEQWSDNSIVRNDVMGYTPGSKIYPHYDSLEEPELGGETVFPHPRITIRPVEGSAIYWISTLNHGNNDMEMLHAVCPVLAGRKNVLTKTMQLHYRFPKMQCSPYRYQKFKHFPGSKVLRQRLYSKLGKYLQNENKAGRETDYLLH